MRIFVAGATGALGQSLVPRLVARGHEVVGTTRTPDKAAALRALGAEPVVVDALDRSALHAAVLAARPDVVVHQLTALSELGAMRNFDRGFAVTNRLRTEATDTLVAAAQEAGAARIVAQSFAGWPAARTGGPVKAEDAPFDPAPARAMRESLAAIRHLERVVTEAGGVALRYGGFYGPGTGLAPGAEQVELVRRRRFPIVGDGGGVWSFIHIEDAADATVAAIEGDATGVFNIVDDEPAPVREWLPALARAAGAKPPRRLPLWLGRLAAGGAVALMMTDIRGASNAKAKAALHWTPRHPSWRTGFREVLN